MPSTGTQPVAAGNSSEHQHSDRDRSRRTDDEARRTDPHGQHIADTASRDEPKASPTSDRNEIETTSARVKRQKATR